MQVLYAHPTDTRPKTSLMMGMMGLVAGDKDREPP